LTICFVAYTMSVSTIVAYTIILDWQEQEVILC
jgi:hypothetical protein